MGPENGINLAEVDYFPLQEYVDRIKVEDFVLQHMEETNKDFDKYLRCLSQYDNYSVIYYWMDNLAKELKYSQAIEKHYIKGRDIIQNDVFFDTLQMSHARIKRLHQFVMHDEKESDYRTDDVWVGRFDQLGNKHVYWNGVKPETVKQFMDDFITFYKSNSLSVINTNPFLKSALTHLLFVRIHPFTDGNGRTARIIHNMKFTESINKIHGMKLKISPLNLSQSILINQPTYAKTINNIYFDLEHDSNFEINKWFDFILNMVDEQLFFSMERIPKLDRSFQTLSTMKDTDTSEVKEQIDKMKIKL